MTPATRASKDESLIQKQVDAFVAAWNRHDATSMAGVYAEDADLINPQGRTANSRAEIERLFRDEHAAAFRNSHFSATRQSMRFLTQDLAVITYGFEVNGATDPSGNSANMRGYFTNVMKKQGDAWQVLVCRPMIPASPQQR